MLLLSSGSLYNYGLNRFFGLTKKAGFSALEIIISDLWDSREVEYLNRLSRNFNLKILAFHAPFSNMKRWKTPQERFLNSLKLSGKMKVETLVVHSYEPNNRTFFKWLKMDLKKIQKKTEVKIAVENLPRHYKGGKRPVYGGMDPLKLLDFDYLCLDTTHLATTPLDLFDVYRKIKEKVAHIHLSDAIRLRALQKNEEDDHLVPGEGKLPLASFLKQLKQEKYKGTISLELRPEVLGEGDERKIVERLKKARNFVERYF